MVKNEPPPADNASVVDYDVTSFLYSKYQAESELKLVENKLRDHGIPLDDMEMKSTITFSTQHMIGGGGTIKDGRCRNERRVYLSIF